MNGHDMDRLFEIPPSWTDLWVGMPEFVMGDQEPIRRIVVNFSSHEDVAAFASATGMRLTDRTDSLWFPPYERDRASDWVYVDGE